MTVPLLSLIARIGLREPKVTRISCQHNLDVTSRPGAAQPPWNTRCAENARSSATAKTTAAVATATATAAGLLNGSAGVVNNKPNDGRDTRLVRKSNVESLTAAKGNARNHRNESGGVTRVILDRHAFDNHMLEYRASMQHASSLPGRAHVPETNELDSLRFGGRSLVSE